MNKLIQKNNIENKIYEIRGKQVMLDSDLAKLYQCSNGTKSINLTVKRHLNRFPERYMFQLTKEEFENLKFQFETSSLNKHGGIRKMPFVFTEEGVAMLATVLKTSVAEKVSIQIMDAFVTMRKYISNNLIEQKYINNQVLKNTDDIRILQKSFKKFEEKKKVNEIYFNGQIYDAYSKIIDIFKKANQELIIIDAYSDKNTLDIIAKISVNVILITKNNKLLKPVDIDKYQEQYNNLTVIFNDTFHDRYFILDKKEIYHCGTSLNYIGSKTFSINILEDNIVKSSLIKNVENIIMEIK